MALYQSGDVDFLVATDAIGMGLNLDVDHVAFAGTRKFDGQVHRALTPAELAQIAGRAGRHMNDGTFGVTGAVEPFSSDLIERLETHNFDSLSSRCSGAAAISTSARSTGCATACARRRARCRLSRARIADDMLALENVSHDREVTALAASPASPSAASGTCARSPTTARSRARTTPSWSPRSTSS